MNGNLIVSPYVVGEYERLWQLVDAIVEYETGEENKFHPEPHKEETRRVDVMVRNADFYSLRAIDPTMERHLERIAETMRLIVWRKPHV